MIEKLEIALIQNIIRLLMRGSDESALWQAKKLQDFGLLESMNRELAIDLLPEIMDDAMREIDRAIKAGASRVDVYAKSLAEQLPIDSSPKLKAVYAGWYRVTGQQLNRMAGSMLNSAKRIYTDTVEKVAALNLSGAIPLRQAIRDTCYQWAADGIKGFRDKADREWSAEAYAQTLLRSTTANARREAGFARMEELELDLIIVSSHLDARPGCEPYQGRIFSLYGKTEGFDTLDDTTYGEPDGLFGINCRHTYAPYTEGMAAVKYDKDDVELAYKESQEQRRLERAIRKEKKELAAAQALGDKAGIKHFGDRVKAAQAKMREFIEESGRTRRYDREQIYGGK